MSENLFSLLIPLFVSGIFSLIGIIFLVVTLRARQKSAASQNWPSTFGKVVRAWVRETEKRDGNGIIRRHYEPHVEYEYSVMGENFAGNKITFGFTPSSNRRSQAEDTVSRYLPGSRVTVFYNPEKPQEAVLERQFKGALTGFFIGGVFLMIASCSFLFLLFTAMSTMIG